jgi:hypothetical protein
LFKEPSEFEEVLRRLGKRHEATHLATFPQIVNLRDITIEERAAATMAQVRVEAAVLEKLGEWSFPGSSADVLARRREILKREFRWDEDNGLTDPDELWRTFKGAARARHRQHFGQVHRTYGPGIGLVSRRETNRLHDLKIEDAIKKAARERQQGRTFSH